MSVKRRGAGFPNIDRVRQDREEISVLTVPPGAVLAVHILKVSQEGEAVSLLKVSDDGASLLLVPGKAEESV